MTGDRLARSRSRWEWRFGARVGVALDEEEGEGNTGWNVGCGGLQQTDGEERYLYQICHLDVITRQPTKGDLQSLPPLKEIATACSLQCHHQRVGRLNLGFFGSHFELKPTHPRSLSTPLISSRAWAIFIPRGSEDFARFSTRLSSSILINDDMRLPAQTKR